MRVGGYPVGAATLLAAESAPEGVWLKMVEWR